MLNGRSLEVALPCCFWHSEAIGRMLLCTAGKALVSDWQEHERIQLEPPLAFEKSINKLQERYITFFFSTG